MSQSTTNLTAGPSAQNTGSNSLTVVLMPRWTWIVVAGAALVVGAAITVVLSEQFALVGWVVLSGLLYIVGMYLTTLVLETRRRATDMLWKNLVWTAFFIALVPLISVIWTVVANGLPTLISNPGILTDDMSDVVGADDQATQAGEAPLMGGILHGLIGTLTITLMAMVISVPVGLLASIYLVEYGTDNWFSKAIRFFVDVMTGIPSIVAGLFAFSGMTLFVSTFISDSPAALQSVKMGFTASIALSVLMIPVVVRSTEEMLRVVPNELREASYALGVRKWRTITKVVLPTAMSGIASGITLAIARVAGETAPILVTAGYAVSVNWSVFSGWVTALPVYIYRQLINPTAPSAPDPAAARAWAAALILILIVMGLNLIARMIAHYFAPKKSGR